MRKLRSQEARQLIGGSVNKAKAIFVQNISSAATAFTKSTKTAPAKPVRNSITRSTSSQDQQLPDQISQEAETRIDSASIPNARNSNPLAKSVMPPKPLAYSSKTNENGNDLIQPVDDTKEQTADTFSPQHLPSAATDDYSETYSTIKRSPYAKANVENSHEAKASHMDSKENNCADIVLQSSLEYTWSYGKLPNCYIVRLISFLQLNFLMIRI